MHPLLERAQHLTAGFRGHNKERQRNDIHIGRAPYGSLDLDARGEFRKARTRPDGNLHRIFLRRFGVLRNRCGHGFTYE